jgi:hypothetical protein
MWTHVDARDEQLQLLYDVYHRDVFRVREYLFRTKTPERYVHKGRQWGRGKGAGASFNHMPPHASAHAPHCCEAPLRSPSSPLCWLKCLSTRAPHPGTPFATLYDEPQPSHRARAKAWHGPMLRRD